jgi:CrcB protein
MLNSILAISVGAAVGAIARWWLGMLLNTVFPTVPPGTLMANLIGGYLIGMTLAVFAQYPGIAPFFHPTGSQA